MVKGDGAGGRVRAYFRLRGKVNGIRGGGAASRLARAFLERTGDKGLGARGFVCGDVPRLSGRTNLRLNDCFDIGRVRGEVSFGLGVSIQLSSAIHRLRRTIGCSLAGSKTRRKNNKVNK